MTDTATLPVPRRAELLGRGRLRSLVLLLFFLSGACGLVYEVVWMRELTLVFGATAPATSTILASFFAGLALGSFWLGRAIDRGWAPLRVYAALEAGVGVFAFLMPFLLSGLDDVYVLLHRRFDASPAQLTAARFTLSFLLLLVPATLMGGTLPVLVKFFADRRERLGWTAARLYAVNTLGAVVGTLGAGFFLILLLGLREAAWLAGVVNLLLAGAALLLARHLESVPPLTPDRQPPAGEYPERIARLALFTAGVSGFCGLALEVLWTRALVFFLDNSTHAFSTMLTAFLLGIALGGFAAARVARSGASRVAWLGATQLLVGLTALLAMPILNGSSPVIQQLSSTAVDAWLPWKWMGLRFATSLSVMLVPTLLMGMTLPLAIEICTRSSAVAGTSVGKVYATNTLAGVAGSLIAGFALIPAVGIRTGIVLVAALNLLAGMIVLFVGRVAGPRVRWPAALVSAGAFGLVAAALFTGGPAVLSSYYERMESVAVLSYDEGVGSTVKVFRDERGDKFLSIDGFPVAGTSPGMQDAQKSLAHVPMLLTPVPSPRVNIIGFGSGGTSSGIYRYGVSRIDCVELVPGVIEAARWFPEMNRGILDARGYTLIPGDGRNYALVSEARYDVISIDATSPKMAGNGSLYTIEFYRLLRERLSEDGLLVQWLPFHLLSDTETRMTARTFQAVFPHTTLWLSPMRHHGVLAGTMKPLRIDVEALRQKLELPATREELEPFHTTTVLDFLSWFVMGEEALARYAGDAPLNTDDHPLLEFTPALAFFNAGRYQLQNLARFQELRESVLPLLANTGPTAAARTAYAARVQQRYVATQHAIRGDVLYYLGRRADADQEYARALLADPQSREWLAALRLF